MCVFTHVGANGSLLNKCTQKGSQKGSSPDLCSTSGKYKRQIEDGKMSWFSSLEVNDSEVSKRKCDKNGLMFTVYFIEKWVAGLEIAEQVVRQNVETNALGLAVQMSFG